MKVGKPIFPTRWERVGFCCLPTNGSFNLTKQVDRNEDLTTVVLDLGLQPTVTGKTILQRVRANLRRRGKRFRVLACQGAEADSV
jgi:hypothetical protein